MSLTIPSEIHEQIKRDLEALDQDYLRVCYSRQLDNWNELCNTIHHYVLVIRTENFDDTAESLFRHNLIRGRGLFCHAVISTQTSFPDLTPVYAALVAVFNAKLWLIGDLFVKRLFHTFVNSLECDMPHTVFSSAIFIAHLVNQKVIRAQAALELINLVQARPRYYSIELTVVFLLECGQALEASTESVDDVYDYLEWVMSTDYVEERVKTLIEHLLESGSDGFDEYPAVIDQLHLGEYRAAYTHHVGLTETTDLEIGLNTFAFDANFDVEEHEYFKMSSRILSDEHRYASQETLILDNSNESESDQDLSDDEMDND